MLRSHHLASDADVLALNKGLWDVGYEGGARTDNNKEDGLGWADDREDDGPKRSMTRRR